MTEAPDDLTEVPDDHMKDPTPEEREELDSLGSSNT